MNNFTLHIQVDAGVEELARWLQTSPGLALAPIETRRSLRGGWVDFGDEDVHLRLFESSEYDPKLIDEEDGWLYYRYILESTSVASEPSLERLQNVANILLARVRDLGGEVAILSDWDDEGIDL
jgi:hypothetical protein